MADVDLSGISIHKLNKFAMEYLMADITKCGALNCSKRFVCARYARPSTPEEAMQKYERHHPEAPWLCFYKLETEQKETLKK